MPRPRTSFVLNKIGAVKNGLPQPAHPLIMLVVRLRNASHSAREIQEAIVEQFPIDVSHQTVNNLLHKIRATWPFVLHEEFLTPNQLCRELLCARGIFWRVYGDGALSTKVVNLADGSICFRKSDLPWIKDRLLHQEGRNCSVCNRRFLPWQDRATGPRLRTCSSVCSKEWNRRLSHHLNVLPATLDTVTGWRKELLIRIQLQGRPTFSLDEIHRWCTIPAASKATWLTEIQVRWLVVKQVLTSVEHPTNWHHGKRKILLVPLQEVALLPELKPC